MFFNISPDLPEEHQRLLQEVNDEAERIYQEMKKNPPTLAEMQAAVDEKREKLLDNLEATSDFFMDLVCSPIEGPLNELKKLLQ